MYCPVSCTVIPIVSVMSCLMHWHTQCVCNVLSHEHLTSCSMLWLTWHKTCVWRINGLLIVVIAIYSLSKKNIKKLPKIKKKNFYCIVPLSPSVARRFFFFQVTAATLQEQSPLSHNTVCRRGFFISPQIDKTPGLPEIEPMSHDVWGGHFDPSTTFKQEAQKFVHVLWGS